MYPQLSAIKQEARAAGITVTPAFVVRGPSGSKVVTKPSSASQVIAAIKSVQ
jgi:protein-disulfide isomerase